MFFFIRTVSFPFTGVYLAYIDKGRDCLIPRPNGENNIKSCFYSVASEVQSGYYFTYPFYGISTFCIYFYF